MSYEWVGQQGTGSGVVRGPDGRQSPVAWRKAPDGEVEVWIDGRIHRIEPASRPRRSGKARADSQQSQLVAGMPGVVLQLRVEPGQAVEQGQVLVVMESMKMELTLEAPRAGRVQSVHCKAGQMVQMGAVLVELEGIQ